MEVKFINMITMEECKLANAGVIPRVGETVSISNNSKGIRINGNFTVVEVIHPIAIRTTEQNTMFMKQDVDVVFPKPVEVHLIPKES